MLHRHTTDLRRLIRPELPDLESSSRLRRAICGPQYQAATVQRKVLGGDFWEKRTPHREVLLIQFSPKAFDRLATRAPACPYWDEIGTESDGQSGG